MSDKYFVVKNGLTVNTNFSVNSSILTFGNSSANITMNTSSISIGSTIVNTTFFSSTANNSLYLGNIPASSYAQLSAIPNLTSNNSLYLGGVISSNYAQLSGANFTGNILNSSVNPAIIQNKNASGGSNQLLGQTNGNKRWQIQLGTAGAENGSNSGSDFGIYNYADNGTYLGNPLNILRSNGLVNINYGLNVTGATVSYQLYSATTPHMLLEQTSTSWGVAANFNSYRYLTTSSGAIDGNFRQVNIGAGGIAIGYNNTPIYNSSDALYINGNVGIGTTAPAYNLDIYSINPTMRVNASNNTQTSTLLLQCSGVQALQIAMNGTSGYIHNLNSGGTTYYIADNNIFTNYAGNHLSNMDINGNIAFGSDNGDYGRTWDLVLTRNKNSATQVGIINNAIGANAVARLEFVGGTANSSHNIDLNDNNGVPYVTHYSASAVRYDQYASNAHLFTNVGGTEYMRIQNGRVGIGTTAPGYTLDVIGNAHISSDLNINGRINSNNGLDLNNGPASNIIFTDNSAGTDFKTFDIYGAGGALNFRLVNDADTAATNWMTVNRTGYANPVVTINGSLLIPTVATSDNSNNAASTSFVRNVIPTFNYAPLSGANFTGAVTAPYMTTTTLDSGGAGLRIQYPGAANDFMIRNDGNNTYFLFSNSQNAIFNNLRPFNIQNSTGLVTMSNGLTISTLPLSDNSNNAASTSFVRNNLGNFSNYIYITSTSTLASNVYGAAIQLAGGGYTVTLPTAASAAFAGQTITFYGGSGSTTIAPNAADYIYSPANGMGVSNGTPVILKNGETITLMSHGPSSNEWDIVGGSFLSGGSAPGAGRSSLKIVASGTAGTITANYLTLFNSSGNQYKISNFNASINSTYSGYGGVDTGTIGYNSLYPFYYVYAIYNPASNTSGCIFSLSLNNPTLPSGFTYFYRIGTVAINSSNQFVSTIQYDNVVAYTNTQLIKSIIGTSSFTAISVGAFIPSTASHIKIGIYIPYAGNAQYTSIAPNSSYTTTTAPISQVYGNAVFYDNMLLESSNIYYFSGSSGVNNIYTNGWTDNI